MSTNTTRVVSLALALGLIVASLSGCGPAGVAPAAGAQEARSGKARLAAPLEGAPVGDLVAGNTAFALDLYRALYNDKANVFYSPYSISLALAMTFAGARGQTEQEMASALHFALPQEQLHPAFNALDQALAARGKDVPQDQGQPFRLHIANALWGQQGYAFQQAFLDLLAENYGAGLRLVDYKKAAEEARQTINRWVEEQTEGKIKDLLPAGSLNDLTRLVLSNAVYFNAGWQHTFDEGATQDGAFHLLDGSTVDVPMMHQSTELAYGEGDGYQAVELPYVGGDMSMVILLPAAGQFDAFARGLDAGRLQGVLDGMGPAQVDLALPRFTFQSEFSLKDALVRLGAAQAFTSDADFSGMTGRKELSIDNVYHKAFVKVDEKGTEAAAATAVVVGITAMPAQSVTVQVDRPFIFLVRDVQTGAILFVGHVVNPK